MNTWARHVWATQILFYLNMMRYLPGGFSGNGLDALPSRTADVISLVRHAVQRLTGALECSKCALRVAGAVWYIEMVSVLFFSLALSLYYINRGILSSSLLETHMYFSCWGRLDFSACLPNSVYFSALFLPNCLCCSTLSFPYRKSYWKQFNYSFQQTLQSKKQRKSSMEWTVRK